MQNGIKFPLKFFKSLFFITHVLEYNLREHQFISQLVQLEAVKCAEKQGSSN